jgi:hypothetical protein
MYNKIMLDPNVVVGQHTALWVSDTLLAGCCDTTASDIVQLSTIPNK